MQGAGFGSILKVRFPPLRLFSSHNLGFIIGLNEFLPIRNSSFFIGI